MTTLNHHLRMLSLWIDGSYTTDVTDVRELHVRRRIDKITEELGEVHEALGGAVGENPRKGVTHQWDDVDHELLDVATAALGAFLSRNHNAPDLDVAELLADHVEALTIRASIFLCDDPIPHTDHEQEYRGRTWTCIGRRGIWEGM